MGASVFGVHPKILPEDYRSEGWKRSCVFRKNIDTIATWSVFLVHRSGSFFNIDFKHFKGSERRRHYLFHIMWNGRELFPPVLAQQKNYYDAGWYYFPFHLGKRKKYSWEDVRSVRYKSAGRGAYRILIQTDRKICIETGMMENSEEAEKLIKGKGYLGLH